MQRRILCGFCVFFLVVIALGFSKPIHALADTQITLLPEEYTFGRQITFRATLQTDAPINEINARIYFKRVGDENYIMAPVSPDEGGKLAYDYDLMRYPLRPFSRVNYYFEVVLPDGTGISSDQQSFYYNDDRFVWQPLQAGPFVAHWYEGDQTFGQELLDVAQKGLQQARDRLPFLSSPKDVINIYVYANAQEMRSTNLLAGINWVAGHADPDLNLIDVTIPPGPEQKTEMERQIPHELMHILLYLTIGSKDSQLPAWLKEGLASINEIYPNPYYHTILSQAVARNGLLSFTDICKNFPVDASGAYLAYAQAASFTRYLFDQYGSDGIETMVAVYARSSTLDCQDGTLSALGAPLSQLERNWRQTVQEGKTGSTEDSSPWPWLTVLIVVLAAPCILLVMAGFRRTRHAHSPANSRRSA